MENNKKYEYRGIGLDRYEKKRGQEAFDKYCKIYNITNYSDLQLLEELIYKELLQEKMKKNIARKEEIAKKENKDFNVPKYIVEAMNENLEQIFELKSKLGLFDNSDSNDGFKYIQQLKEKFKIWRQENQDRTFACPHCSKMILLYIKPDAWEAMKHPFFESKVLGNKKLWELYKQGKITKKEVAEVLGCSDMYIDWLEKKIYLAKENFDNKTSSSL